MSTTATHCRVAGNRQWPLLVVMALVLAGCKDRIEWTEDVELPDERMVTLTRLQEMNGPPGEPFGPPTPSYHRFDFVNPDNGEKVRWENERDLGTVALMLVEKKPWLLTTPVFGGSHRRYGCREPPYIALRYVEGEWREAPLEKLPVKVLRANMTGSDASSDYGRRYIEKHGSHLSVPAVADLVDNQFSKKVIDLRGLKRVTHRPLECGYKSDYMTRDADASK